MAGMCIRFSGVVGAGVVGKGVAAAVANVEVVPVVVVGITTGIGGLSVVIEVGALARVDVVASAVPTLLVEGAAAVGG